MPAVSLSPANHKRSSRPCPGALRVMASCRSTHSCEAAFIRLHRKDAGADISWRGAPHCPHTQATARAKHSLLSRQASQQHVSIVLLKVHRHGTFWCDYYTEPFLTKAHSCTCTRPFPYGPPFHPPSSIPRELSSALLAVIPNDAATV